MPVCWSCSKEAGNDFFCTECQIIQPARPKDHFAVMGLERKYSQDSLALEKRYRELSRQFHPDKFARAPARERRFSLEQSTRLNEAFKTLRDPIRRAEYLMGLEGIELASEEGSQAAKDLPLEFYTEVMEDREALAEAKEADAEDEGGRVDKLAQAILERQQATFNRVAEALLAWELNPDPETLKAAVPELAKVRYYKRFLAEVEGPDEF